MTRIRNLFASTLAVALLCAIASPPPAEAQTILRLDGNDFYEASFWTQANANSLVTGINTYGTEILSAARGGTGNAFTKFVGPDNAERTFTLPNASATLAHTGNNLSVFAATTSAQLAGVLSDETGSGGGFVRSTSPTLVTPTLGAATADSINGLTINNSTGTLAIANGKTATANNTLTLQGTDGSTVSFGAGGTVAYTANNLSAFASTTSAQLAGVISNETGSGSVVFSASPALTGNPTAASFKITGPDYDSTGSAGTRYQVKEVGSDGFSHYVTRKTPIHSERGVNSVGGEFTTLATGPVPAGLVPMNGSISARFDFQTASTSATKSIRVNISGSTVYESPALAGNAVYDYVVHVEAFYVDGFGADRIVVTLTSNNPALPAHVTINSFGTIEWGAGFNVLMIADTSNSDDITSGFLKVDLNP